MHAFFWVKRFFLGALVFGLASCGKTVDDSVTTGDRAHPDASVPASEAGAGGAVGRRVDSGSGGSGGSTGGSTDSGARAPRGGSDGGRAHAEAGVDASTGSTDARADGSSDGCRSTCQPLLLAHVLAMFIELQGDDVFLGALSPPNLATVTSILKVAKSGGTVTTLQSGLVGVRSFAVDATNVYFVAGVSVPDSATYAAKLMTTSVDGGSPVALADAEGSAIGTVVADGRVYWGGYSDSLGLSWFSIGASVDGGSRSGTFDVNARAPYAVTADSRYVYWQASKPTGALVRAPLAGGSVETLQGASGVGLCAEIAVSGDFLFCTDFSHRKLVRVPLNEPYQYIPPIDSNLVPRFAIDDQFIYWISSSTHSIERARFDGTDAVTVVSRTSGIGDLAVDATGIYWTEWDVADATISSGSVMKLEK